MIKSLVISADSKIGLQICNSIGAIGTTRRKPSIGRLPFDLTSGDILPSADTTYFCSGINGFKECDANKAMAHFVNVECTVKRAVDQIRSGCRVVLLSSCAAETHPDTVYGSLKLETEAAFLKFGPLASIFRFGPVQFEGRVTYQNHDYHPITVEKLIATVTAEFKPGLHKIYNAPGLS